MRKFIFTPLIALLLSFGLSFNLTAQDLMITGVADGDLTGGLPKAIELYVVNDIADLSTYGLGSANNGGGTDGEEFTFPAVAATAGDFIYVASETTEFTNYFGFAPDYADAMAGINGDDAVELFNGGTAYDVFGDINVDGNGTTWEYEDGWAYRVDGTTASATFTEADWTFANGALIGFSDNASATNPMPVGTFTMGGGGSLALPFYETYETWPLANWTVDGTSTSVWESDDGSSYGPGSVTEGLLAAMFDVYNASSGNTTTMTTDVIDMDGAVNPTLSFDFWMDGWSADPILWLKVEMTTNGSTWNEIFYHEYDGNGGWNSESMILTGANATTQIRIIGSSDYGSDNLFVDKLAIEEITCPAPTALALDANTTTEATFSWTENGSAIAWNLIYGAPGFNPLTEGTPVAAGTNPYTITALTASTDYDVYVQADCSGGDLSTMDGPVSFTTDCGVYTTPFSEDFTSYVPNCWSEAAGILADPVSFTSTTSSAWADDGFANVGTTGAAKVNVYGTAREEWLMTPEIDLGDGSTPMQLEFDLALTAYAGTGAATAAPDDKFAVIVSTDGGATWTSANTLAIWDNVGSPYVYDNIATAGERIILDLSGHTGIVKFGIYAESTVSNGDNDLFIDNVDVLETPDCTTPTGLTLDANTTTEATFSWTENGSAIAWNLIYGAPGFDPTSAGTTVTAGTNPYTITGLTASTGYDVYVQADCSAGDLSTMDGPVTVTTDADCSIISTFPWTEDFDGDWTTWCWTVVDNDSDGTTWEQDDSYITPHSGSWTAHGMGNNEDYLITPQIGVNSANLFIEWYDIVESTSNNNTYDVLVSITNTDPGSFTDNLGTFDCTNTSWTKHALSLAAYNGQDIYIAFYQTYSAATYYGFGIDDVELLEITCPAPTALALDANTTTEATFSWTENGTATAWNLIYGAPGFDPTSAGTTVATGTNPYTITGLTASTDYDVYVQADCSAGDLSTMDGPVTVTTDATCSAPTALALDANTTTEATFSWTENGSATAWNLIYGAPAFNPLTEGTTVAAGTNPYTITALTASTDYDVYVQADCSGGDLSTMDGPVTVFTGYCQPAPTSVDGSGITNVTFGETTIVDNATGTETNNYGDYSGMVGNGAQGTDITVSITFETGFDYETKIWIDWNNDLVFNDVEELVYTGTSSSDNPTTLDATFSIPFVTPLGSYRMRIGSADTGPIDACYTDPYGSFEDYTLEVTAAPACPVITGLTTTAVGADVATIDWNALGTSEWNIKISDSPIDPATTAGNIEDVSATTTKPYTTTEVLTPNTTYYFYVQATCGADWSAEGMFATNCEAVATLPWTETFEDASLTRDCWSQIQETGTKEWTFDEGSIGGAISTAYEGTLNAVFTSSGAGPHITKLVTPVLDLSSGSNYAVDFYYGQESWFSDQNSLKVYYRENQTASWTEIDDYPTEAASWTFSSIVLPNVSATYQIAFEGVDEYGRANVIDNVTVREVSTETDFLTYSFPEQTGAADINYTAYTIDVEVGNGTDFTVLVADYTLSTGATADIAGTSQETGVTANDFSSPVTYTVTAEDGTTTQEWDVTVTEAAINDETDIVSYTFPEATTSALIDNTEKTVDIEVAWNADVTALVAEFELSYGASADIAGTVQESGVTENDFTDPVVYTITAEDATTTTDWTVTVTIQDIPQGATCADPINYGTINDPEVVTSIDPNGRELWYTFTITEPYMNIQVSTCASVYDTKVWVYDGCEGNELAYDDDAPTDFCGVDNNQSLAEIDFLGADTYYVLITPYSSGTDISDPTTGLYISGTPDYITPYVDNTTLTLTPEVLNVATGDDASAVLDVVYPTTVSSAMPVDMMTDAMIDLSELTAGAVVEVLDDGTSLGTYTVTGGETVWASEAFASVNRVPANMTGGLSFSWDVVISGLDAGTYNVSATLYLGLDADLTAETNMTEAATDAMVINVAAPFIDLALISPQGGGGFACELTDPLNVPVEIENVGNTTIATGETITFTLEVNGTNEFTEDIILSEDLLPGEILALETTNTVDFTALDTYLWEAIITYTGDTDPNNDFTSGYTVHFEQNVEFVDAVNDTITIASTDWPYTIETNLTLSTDSVLVSTYEWELDASTETTLTVNADGWYKLWVTTEDCTIEDSVYVLAYNSIEGLTADEFSVYPNPNNGQFMIEMNLVEKQDVILSIFNSNGQLVRELKFDDIDNFARAIDMNNVAEGLYHIRINAGGKMFNSQVVIR